MLLLALPPGILALGAGTALALGAAALVLAPLVSDEVVEPRPTRPRRAPSSPTDQSSAIDALREIEFDRETGKLSDADYTALKASYTQAALDELRARDAAGTPTPPGVTDDAVERAIAGYRRHPATTKAVCPVDGARPEADALFCSACGRFLGSTCSHCGTAVASDDARFCTGCGNALGVAAAA